MKWIKYSLRGQENERGNVWWLNKKPLHFLLSQAFESSVRAYSFPSLTSLILLLMQQALFDMISTPPQASSTSFQTQDKQMNYEIFATISLATEVRSRPYHAKLNPNVHDCCKIPQCHCWRCLRSSKYLFHNDFQISLF